MIQSIQPTLKIREPYINLILSDPELDKLEKHPDDEESPEEIPFEEVMPEDVPPRENVPEELPVKEKDADKETIKKSRDAEDKSDNNTPPVQL